MDNIETTKNKAEEKKPHKLFNYIMGNPPYQEDKKGGNDNFAAPVYHTYMDAVGEVSDAVELITPARFLFNAGNTPAKWNQKKLNDEHFKVMKYTADSKEVFPRADIKGGVAVTYKDDGKTYEPIKAFVDDPVLRSIKEIIASIPNYISINTIMFASESYKFTDELYVEHPEIRTLTKKNKKGEDVSLLSKGHDYDLKSNVFESLDKIAFFNDVPDNNEVYARIEGVSHNKRKTMYIKKKYIKNDKNFDKWKVFLPQANGSGAIGEVLSTPLIGEPLTGHTQTFLSFGAFDTREEAEACMKYIKTKFARCMLGILKVTQSNAPATWKYVPLQDFTSSSDIDWSVSIPEIDQQLYAKYGLTEEEIEFIETHVKPMS